ncbi:hypothetical protein JCM21714_749 [Gracilibacillus boraciitolerans JCM 21714]|uniref:Uncharacterized protein n=1 Tax=Gracilibacillus boraciitolerans JCM 21714 TaxID=1298598 RepID=W4VF06_9BACI|nr:DUF5325 family protein [Gracilibacillus boraciitolerans]GAE91792.1 hypothetical protein JCM21714_749 [Gracilibacillus boraciitolerans JCM 21714]
MNIQISRFLLAICVILAFSAVGIGIALRNIWFIIIAFIIGFVLMGFGISIKKKKAHKN